ncbi:hypothetical protein Tco_0177873 [Tanacetum coccineum]
MVAYLQKSEGSIGFHQIVDFLTTSHIQYALTESPAIFVSLTKQFWQIATASTLENGDMEIIATIDGKVKTASEASIRRHHKLKDFEGINDLPTTEIFEQLALMGYVSNSDKLTFQKGCFSPQWKFLIHTILQCLSSKKTAWEQFSSNIATQYEESFQGIYRGGHSIVSNNSCPGDFIKQETDVPQPSSPTQTYVADEAASTGVDDRHGGATTTVSSLEAGQDSVLENDLKQTKKVYGVAFTKLIKKGRKIAEIDEDPDISLVHQMIHHDAQTQERQEHDLEPHFEFTAHVEVYTTEPDISTANVPVSIVGAKVSTAIPVVNTAAERQVYIRRSAAKRKDKGKAIMKEDESIQKKTKLQLEQERLGYEVALRLQEQLDEDERQRLQAEEIGRYSDANKARLPVEMINERKRLFAQQRVEQRRNTPMTQAQQRTYMCNYIKHIGSHTPQQLKKLSLDEIKDLSESTMKRVKDFVPMKSDRSAPKIAAGSSKRDAEEELNQESSKRQKTGEGSEPTEESKDKESDELSQEQLQQLMIIVPEVGMNVEALQTKYPIIDWEVFTEDSRMYWKIIRVGNHTEVYQIFEDMLKNFDRDDLVKLWSLVHERFNSTDPTEDKERELWVELKRLFEPNDDDELWKSQRYMHDPLTWRLYDTCGVHHVSTERGHDIFMLIERDYPLTRGLMTLMLCNQLLVEEYLKWQMNF